MKKSILRKIIIVIVAIIVVAMAILIYRLYQKNNIEIAYESALDYPDCFYDKKSNKYGFVNADGEIVIEAQFKNARGFDENGLAWVVAWKEEDDCCRDIINEKGDYIFPLEETETVVLAPDYDVVFVCFDGSYKGSSCWWYSISGNQSQAITYEEFKKVVGEKIEDDYFDYYTYNPDNIESILNGKTENDSENNYTDYRVIEFFEEDIDSVPVNIEKVESYADGEVYTYDIVYDGGVTMYGFDNDRFNLGTFLFKDDEIYLLEDAGDDFKEDDFYESGIKVFAQEKYEDEVNGQDVKLHNDGYLCVCNISESSSESGYYWEYVFNSDKELTYFRSGYGAEGDPIEITLTSEDEIKKVFEDYEESNLTDDDFTVTYNGFNLGPKTSYQELVASLPYPENFEVNNNGYTSTTEDGYRWQLNYPDQSDYNYEVRINCLSPAIDPEGPDSYIENVWLGIPTSRGISKYDSIFSLAEVYGAPDEIREAEYFDNYKDIVYENDGNQLIFTISPDCTVVYVKIDYKGE